MKSTTKLLPLSAIAIGARGRIISLKNTSPSYRQKLLVMGCIPGTEFTLVRAAPLGDPIELHIRGFALSVRKAEVKDVMVEPLGL